MWIWVLGIDSRNSYLRSSIWASRCWCVMLQSFSSTSSSGHFSFSWSTSWRREDVEWLFVIWYKIHSPHSVSEQDKSKSFKVTKSLFSTNICLSVPPLCLRKQTQRGNLVLKRQRVWKIHSGFHITQSADQCFFSDGGIWEFLSRLSHVPDLFAHLLHVGNMW